MNILLPLAKRSWRFYLSADFTVKYEGIRIPILRGMGLNLLRPADASLTQVIQHFLNCGRGGSYVDVGANQGQSLLAMARLGVHRPYLGFEPNVHGAYYVRRLIEANQWPDCEVLPVGLSSEQGAATLAHNGPGDASATVETEVRPPAMYRDSIRVGLGTGDSFLKDIDEVFLVKLDCEGHEAQALEGMSEFLKSKNPPVYFEMMGYGHLLDRSYDREYFGSLSDAAIETTVEARHRNGLALEKLFAGYRLSQVRGEGLRPISRLTEALSGSGEMNFLAEPS